MALFEESSLRRVAFSVRQTKAAASTTAILRESYGTASLSDRFNVFLCHSYLDADVILGLKTSIEALGYSVYLDWFEDRQFRRSGVTKEIAGVLRERMANCDSLFFATSTNSSYSKWMPWECGYFDGSKGKVAICPVSDQSQGSYAGQEYLGLYPYIEQEKDQAGRLALWVCESRSKYVSFDAWLVGKKPVEQRPSG